MPSIVRFALSGKSWISPHSFSPNSLVSRWFLLSARLRAITPNYKQNIGYSDTRG